MEVLNDQKRRIFDLLISGLSIEKAAKELKIPVRAAKRARDEVLQQLRVRTAAGAVAKLIRRRELVYGKSAGCRVELTCREFDMLHGMASGRTDEEIARRLHRSVSTSKEWAQSLFGKLGVNNRTAAVVEGFRLKLLR